MATATMTTQVAIRLPQRPRSQSEPHAHAIHLLHRWIAEHGGSLLWNMAPESQWHPFEDRAQWARLAENRRWMLARPSWMPAQ